MQATFQLINCQASQSKSRLFYVFFNEVDNFFGWCARSEDSFYASFFQAWDIGFRNYAAAAWLGALTLIGLQEIGIDATLAAWVGMATVFLVRAAAIRFRIKLPSFQGRD